MKKIISIMLIASVLIGYAALAASVQAYDAQNPPPTNPYAWAEDASHIMQDIFNLGDQIYINAYTADTPYNVTVIDPTNTVRCEWDNINTEYFESGLLSTNATDKLGKWEIWVNDSAHSAMYAAGEYDVIPEVALGAIGLLAA